MKKMLRFVYILIVVMLTAYISSMFTHEGTSTWYQTLKKPAIVPPDVVFSIVWSIIYVLMILSVFMIFNTISAEKLNLANDLFLAQCFLQILWCLSFFSLGYLGFAMAIIVLLVVTVGKMAHFYYQIHKISAFLLLPYLGWLIFAGAINGIYVWEYGMNISTK